MMPRTAVLPLLVVAFVRCVSSDDAKPGTIPLENSLDASVADATSDTTTRDAVVGDDASRDANDGASPAAACSPVDAGGAPSCATGGAGLSNCGASGTDCCCASPGVSGGMYFRTYDPLNADGGVTLEADGGAVGLADPATVSALRLDKYDVTVGRFRQFVNALMPPDGGVGWLPAAASGKHTHLNGGQGLVSAGATSPDGGVVYELGWLAFNDSQLAPTDANLTTACSDPASATWTASTASQENLPINCTNWWESYAFCIWDGGFLPSEAEFGFAAAGGSEQRLYPWGSTDPGTASQYAIYGNHYNAGDAATCSGVSCIAPVGSATQGAGRWGHLDLVGSMFQRLVDGDGAYINPCADCARTEGSTFGILRGGGFDNAGSVLFSSVRNYLVPNYRSHRAGIRCARTP